MKIFQLASETDSFSTYDCPSLTQDVAREIDRVLKEFVSSPDNARKAIEIIERHVLPNPTTFELAHHLLYCTAVFVSWPAIFYTDVNDANLLVPSLQSIFDNNAVWKKLLTWAFQEASSGPPTMVLNLISRVRNVFLETNRTLLDKSVELQTLHVVVKNASLFDDLLTLSIDMKSYGERVGVTYLTDLEKTLRAFDKTFEQVQTYASFFCSWY